MFRRVEVIIQPGQSTEWGQTHEVGLKTGAMYVASGSMVETGLPAPNRRAWRRGVGNKRPRYFFTEYGWRKSGHAVLSEIRSKGFRARIITLKERDPRIRVIYQDKWQVIIHLGVRPQS